MMIRSHRNVVLLFYRWFSFKMYVKIDRYRKYCLLFFQSLSFWLSGFNISLSFNHLQMSKCIFLTLSYYNITIKVAFEWLLIRVQKYEEVLPRLPNQNIDVENWWRFKIRNIDQLQCAYVLKDILYCSELTWKSKDIKLAKSDIYGYLQETYIF